MSDGTTDDLKGRAKEAAGDLTTKISSVKDRPTERRQGKDAIDDVKDKAEGVVDSIRTSCTRTDTTRKRRAAGRASCPARSRSGRAQPAQGSRAPSGVNPNRAGSARVATPGGTWRRTSPASSSSGARGTHRGLAAIEHGHEQCRLRSSCDIPTEHAEDCNRAAVERPMWSTVGVHGALRGDRRLGLALVCLRWRRRAVPREGSPSVHIVATHRSSHASHASGRLTGIERQRARMASFQPSRSCGFTSRAPCSSSAAPANSLSTSTPLPSTRHATTPWRRGSCHRGAASRA